MFLRVQSPLGQNHPRSKGDDGDPLTDKYLAFGWASLFSQFPGSKMVDLARVTFTYDPIVSVSWDFDRSGDVDALTDGLLLLRYAFGLRGNNLTDGILVHSSIMTSQEVEQAIEGSSQMNDIDGDGVVNPLTDGLLLLRYLFGLRGESLVNDVVSLEATRTSAADIEAYIESHMP